MSSRFVSPRQLARAAGVSESSVKRWCDQGVIPTVKTAGGHRRLTLEAAAEFLRTAGLDARPELLGLPVLHGRGERTVRTLEGSFFESLVAGDEAACERIAVDRHLGGEAMSEFCDSVVAPALHRIGDAWECRDVDVYQERRGCTICLRVFDSLRTLLPVAETDAPLALGGAPECDPYMIPGVMVDLVLRQGGWRTQLLGARLPFASLRQAVRHARPQLFWLSVSTIDDEARFLAEYAEFFEAVQRDVAVVVGGRALTEAVRRRMTFAACCDNLRQLETFAQTLRRTWLAAQRAADRNGGRRNGSGERNGKSRSAASAARHADDQQGET